MHRKNSMPMQEYYALEENCVISEQDRKDMQLEKKSMMWI